MTNKNCLNCEKELTDKYCSGCGQKADTHRISFKNFIFHDLLHGTFHIERGMLFTAKEALIRPGKAALDYISGKRKRYYNVFYLILITIGIMLFIRHFYASIIYQGEGIIEDSHLNETSKTIDEIISQKSKFIMLLFIPLAALNSFILFRRRKLNLSEHFIITGMILLGMLLISTFGHILFFVNLIVQINFTFLSFLIAALIFIHIGYGYFNAFSNDYSKFGIFYRVVLFFVLIFLEIFALLYLLVGFVTNWKFGQVTISPFG